MTTLADQECNRQMDLCVRETSTGIPSQSHIVMSVTKVNEVPPSATRSLEDSHL